MISLLAPILALALAAAPGEAAPGTIGEAPFAAAGSQAAPLQPDEAVSPWRGGLATGIALRTGGMRLSSARENSRVLLFFAGQADGLWGEGMGQAARLRVRLFTGGESEIYVPTDGDAEAAYALGRREFRFVVGRVEVARYPALGIEGLLQAGTLPCFEGTISLAWDTMRLHYFVSPIEAAWVRYYGGAHLRGAPGWPTESDSPAAATALRLRHTTLLPASLLLSVQGDLVKLWKKTDLGVALEGGLGFQALQQSALFNAVVRWQHYRRRGLAPDTSESEAELVVLASATLAF